MNRRTETPLRNSSSRT